MSAYVVACIYWIHIVRLWERGYVSHRGTKSSAALGQKKRDAVPMRQEAPKRKRKA